MLAQHRDGRCLGFTKRKEWTDLHKQMRFILDHTNDTLPFYRDERKANRRYIDAAYRKMKELGIEFEVAPIDDEDSDDSSERRGDGETTQVQSVAGSTKPQLRAVQ